MLSRTHQAPFRIRTDIETAEYADGCVLTTPTRAFEFGYPPGTRSVGVHFKAWGLAPFLPMPAAELTSSGRSPGSRRPGTSTSGGGS
ncbi:MULTISPECIES: hypothetical protein [unclassified Nonomuraea]|uniref:hypothetical protein n=1 Tax=unclassified Nonomuraea TaxID=2593643 RepID=UPI00191C56E8|nr:MULTISPECIES: hypothetical protein [unclassified Nonomuraea]